MKVIVCRRHKQHLFIEKIISAFEELGYCVLFIDLELTKKADEFLKKIDSFSPDFIFSLTANSKISKIIPDPIPIINYELDKIMSEKFVDNHSFKKRDLIFTTYKKDVPVFLKIGAKNVYYLPFFFNAHNPNVDPNPSHEVSFVGTIGLSNDFRWYIEKMNKIADGNPKALHLLEEVVLPFFHQLLKKQKDALETNSFIIPELIDKSLKGEVLKIFSAFNLHPLRSQLLLSKEAAFQQRCYFLNSIDLLSSWGNSDWSQLNWKNNRYQGPAELYKDTSNIYAQSKINLNIQRIYAQDGLSDRVFNVMMAGGFLLTDRNASIQELFIEDRHLVLFSSKQEMLEKINYYRIHPDKRDEIAMNGKKEVLANHSCLSRMRKILDTVLPII